MRAVPDGIGEGTMPNSLAGTLLAIQQRRGALFMLDTSRSLIENWDLRCDRLQDQSAQTLQLVEKLLDCPSLADLAERKRERSIAAALHPDRRFGLAAPAV